MPSFLQILDHDLERCFSAPEKLRELVEQATKKGGEDLAKKLSAFAINQLVNAAPHRPHRWSTASDYTSWKALPTKPTAPEPSPPTTIKHYPT